ncbi:MAG: hypothetical protein IJC66_12370, partial [Kiritimatiellae bacterium]|nr:hypothetical protein [Kiritimatiellia bacterium]
TDSWSLPIFRAPPLSCHVAGSFQKRINADAAGMFSQYWENHSLILSITPGTATQALFPYGVSQVRHGCKNALSWVKALSPMGERS